MAKAITEKKNVNPILLTDPDSGDTYTLEFSRDSVRFAENRGFKIDELTVFPQTNIPALFFYAFRKNHKWVSREKTNALLDELGGLTASEIGRLAELYNLPNESLIITEEGGRKNSRLTLEM